MHSSRDRFLSREEEFRRECANAALIFAGIGAVTLVAMYAMSRLTGDGSILHDFVRVFFPAAAAILVVLLGVGLFLRARPRHYVEVDRALGMVTVIREGEVARSVPLSAIGPLRHSIEERDTGKGRTATYHVARSGAIRELLIHASKSESAARHALETYAKAWNLPYVTATRETRNPEELDVPIHERLKDDEAARTHLPQRAGSRLTVTWTGGGYEIATAYAPPLDRKAILWAVLVPPASLAGLIWPVVDLFDPETPALFRVFIAILWLFVLSLGPIAAARRWRRIRRPPVIRISADGFQFRGNSIPLRSIEDVARAPGAVCNVVSDERIVTVEGDFCEPSERDWLRNEIRRLVIELAS